MLILGKMGRGVLLSFGEFLKPKIAKKKKRERKKENVKNSSW